ncbi:MAG: hypothetical protein QM486_03285 [Flavobacteriaceae bacterium]
MKKNYFLLILTLIIIGCNQEEGKISPQNNNVTVPVVTIINVTDITENTATSGGNIANNGGASIITKGICWSTTPNPEINNFKSNDGIGDGAYTSQLTSLVENTTYYLRAYAANSEGIGYSNEISFTTQEIINNMNGYLLKLMHYPITTLASMSDLITFVYNVNNQIILRKGGIYDGNFDPSTGYIYLFSDKIYDELTYDVNKIIIEQKTSSSEFEIPLYKRTFYLDQENKIIQKIIETTSNPKETIDYTYNSSGKLTYSSSSGLNYSKEINYYYNEISNLDSIVTKEYDKQMILKRKIVESFKNFDSSPNPTKNLIIFEEVFNRSLSKNNYSYYEKLTEEWAIESAGSYSSYRYINRWTFKYDVNGNILFDVY